MNNVSYIVYSNGKPIFIPPIPRPNPVPADWTEVTPKFAFEVIVSEYNRGAVPPQELLTIVRDHFNQQPPEKSYFQVGA